jgi:hypothetical protein
LTLFHVSTRVPARRRTPPLESRTRLTFSTYYTMGCGASSPQDGHKSMQLKAFKGVIDNIGLSPVRASAGRVKGRTPSALEGLEGKSPRPQRCRGHGPGHGREERKLAFSRSPPPVGHVQVHFAPRVHDPLGPSAATLRLGTWHSPDANRASARARPSRSFGTAGSQVALGTLKLPFPLSSPSSPSTAGGGLCPL